MHGLLTLLKKDRHAGLNLRRVLAGQSTFKVGFILLFAVGLLTGMGALFYSGFRFLDTLGGLGAVVMPRLFGLFFLGLSVMLVLSGLVTAFTTFFRAEETAYLLLQPLGLGTISVYKLLQSAAYASWAFFFALIPFIGAYAWHQQLPAAFVLWTLAYSIPLVLLCTGVGTLLCLLGVRWAPRNARLWSALALLGALGAWGYLRHFVGAHRGADEDALFLAALIPGLNIAAQPLWPSTWAAEGILAVTRGQWGRGLAFGGVLVAHVLLVGLLVEAVGRRWFFDAWQRVQYAARRTRREAVLLRPLERALGFLAADLRALVLKDIRIFLRDPQQWVQGVVFFGLLGLYFFNLRNFNYHLLPADWRNLVMYLNLFSVSAVMCSFGSRFIFPQLSLEGHGFWIVGLSPTSMRRVLLAKFLLALSALGTVSLGLMVLSTRMLLVPAEARWVTYTITLAMAVGLSGLATGLGAVFLDLKQQNPAAIVSGFGGTLNLVLSLGFMLLAIVPFAALAHAHTAGHLGPADWSRGLRLAYGWLALLTAAVTLLPLYLGRRSLSRREY